MKCGSVILFQGAFIFVAALCEENPKWRALTDIIAEIEEANKVDSTVGKVLIAVNSTHTCNQLKDYLIKGSHSILIQLLRKLEQPKEQVCHSGTTAM